MAKKQCAKVTYGYTSVRKDLEDWDPQGSGGLVAQGPHLVEYLDRMPPDWVVPQVTICGCSGSSN